MALLCSFSDFSEAFYYTNIRRYPPQESSSQFNTYYRHHNTHSQGRSSTTHATLTRTSSPIPSTSNQHHYSHSYLPPQLQYQPKDILFVVLIQKISNSNGCDQFNQISFKLITLGHSINTSSTSIHTKRHTLRSTNTENIIQFERM